MKKLKKLRLSPNTSMQALPAKARKAAALSIIERKQDEPRQPEKQKRAKKQPRLTDIELSTRSILKTVASGTGKATMVLKETPSRFSTAYTIISIYQDTEIVSQRNACEPCEIEPTVKKPKHSPIIRYVLYPSVLNPTQLGSVAIYCKNASSLHASIVEAGHLFGIPAKRITLETGLSQYIDVTFRA